MKYIFILLFFVCGKLYSQDVIFSQSFLIPETLNSSFTGAIQTTKLGSIHKSQWTNFGLKINSNFAYIDTWFEAIRSGIGISFLNHTENGSNYNFNQVNFNYALAIQISDDWHFRPSISAGIGMKNYGFQNLLLEDQINVNTNAINTSTIDPLLLNDQRLFFDFSSSILLNNETSWIGLTLRHLNKPNISMTENGNIPLDIFMSLHTKVEIPFLRNSRSHFSEMNNFYFLSNFMMQSKYNRLDIGTQYVYNDRLSLGVLLVTNPIKNDENSHMLSSISTFAAIKWEGFKFGYSYDSNTSKIGITGGTHEFSISYDFTLNTRYINRFKCVSYF